MRDQDFEVLPFIPDAAPRNATGYVLNAIPHGATEYLPVQSFVPYSNPLPARPHGALSAQADSGEISVIVSTLDKAYALQGVDWVEVTRLSGDYTPGKWWDLVQWQDQVVAANGEDWMQVIDLPANVNRFDDLTQDVYGRYIGVVKDSFLMIGDTWDPVDGRKSQRVRWCAAEDITSWPIGQNFGDLQDLRGGGGSVTGVVGGEFGIVLRQRAWHRFTFTGTGVAFRNDRIEGNVGTNAPKSVVEDGDDIYFLSNDGFRRIVQGRYSEPIGEGVVDQFFFNSVDPDCVNDVVASPDVRAQNIVWSYVSTTAGGNKVPDVALIYNTAYKRWGFVAEPAVFISWMAQPAVTLEALDALYPTLEDVPGSLDDPQWAGGQYQLSSFDELNRLGFFTGPIKDAEFDTIEMSGGVQALKSRFLYPQASADSIEVSVGVRDKKSEDVVWGSFAELDPDNARIGYISRGKFMRLRLRLKNWDDVIGVRVEGTFGGKR